jgi:hypothetical protein
VDGNGLAVNKGSLTYSAVTIGSLASGQAANFAGVGSIAQADIPNLKIGAGGGQITLVAKVTGTIALAAVGTATTGVATMTGVGSAGVAVGDIIRIMPKAAQAGGVAISGPYIPTTNVINVYVTNPQPNTAGSLVAVGVDALILRVS